MNFMHEALGLGVDPKDLGFLQVCLRGILVFCVALFMIRVANRRFLSKLTAFDVILGFVLGSMLSRAVNGSAPFFETLGTVLVLVYFHRLLARLAFQSKTLGRWIKGRAQVLVRDGVPDPNCLRAHAISENDLLEEARLQGGVERIDRIRLATMERNGHISVLPKN